MNVQHFEKGVQYTDRELIVLARKIGKLATYCRRLQNPDSLIRVEATRQETKKARDQVTVMMTVELPHKQLRAESRKTDAIDALDRCIEKLTPQILRYKDIHTRKGRTHILRSRSHLPS